MVVPRARFPRPIIAVGLGLALALPTATASGPTAIANPVHALRAGEKTGDFVIACRPGTMAGVKKAIAAAGGTVGESYPGAGLVVVSDLGDKDPARFTEDLAGTPGLRYVEEERVIKASFVPNDPAYVDQWNLRRIGSALAWDIERGDPSVVVAVVDSGVDLQQTDLVGRIDTANDRDFVADDYTADDEYGHGTHVAGIIAANTNNGIGVAGMAGGCTILPIRVLDAYGNGDTTKLAAGIKWAADHGADIINVSAGGPEGTQALADAVAYAVDKGSLVVGAAGNTGAAQLDYPAAYSQVISVGAVDSTAAKWGRSQYAAGLDLMAPGLTTYYPLSPSSSVGIISLLAGSGTNPGTGIGTMYGTSMATAHVSAVAALLRSAYPAWTASELGYRMLATAEDLGPAGRDDQNGYGLVRADRALSGQAPGPSPDDSLPGLPLLGSPVVDIVDASFDPVDAYNVSLDGGQHLSAWIEGAAGSTTRLDLLGPGETTLSAPPVTSAISAGTSVRLDYEVPTGSDGTYTLKVSAQAGGGEYRLAWARGFSTEVLIAAPSTCAWGGAATLSGSVVSNGAQPLAFARVMADAWPYGAAGWTAGVASGGANDVGDFALTVRPTRRTVYRVRFTGTTGELASTSVTVTVTPRAALSAPSPTTAVRRNVTFSAAGSLKPKHRAGAHTVKITAWRKESGRWVLRRTVYATNYDRSGYTRYVGRLSLAYRGSWKLVASVPGDSTHVATTSSPKYLTVP